MMCLSTVNQHQTYSLKNPLSLTLIFVSVHGLWCFSCNLECVKLIIIADLPGLGTVWFYPEGVANILLQHRIEVNSGFSVEYSTKRIIKTRNKQDLSYNCETSKGVKVYFMPTEQDLHVLNCAKHFGLNKPGYVFGKKIIDKGTKK